MDRVVPFALDNDIVVVIPAGNDAPTPLNEITPQNLGTDGNRLITVGGVEKNGILFSPTCPNLGNGGSLTIYAAARDVKCAGQTADDAFTTGTGTSLAAPAVAGMAAYFFEISKLDDLWPAGRVAQAMKEFMTLSGSVQRNSNPVPPNLGYQGPRTESVVVAWNRYPVGFEGCGTNSNAKRQEGGGDTAGGLSCPAEPAPEPTSTETPTETTTPTPPADTPTPSPTEVDAGSEEDGACTVFLPDGSTCVQTAGSQCGFGTKVECPLGKRGAHPATQAYVTHFPAMTIATVAAVVTAF